MTELVATQEDPPFVVPEPAPQLPSAPLRGVVEVAGPDGVGKSTLVDLLLAGPLADRPVLRLHHRPGLLPTRGGAHADPSDPHGQAAYPLVASWLKVLYLWLDHVLAAPRLARAARRGWVVLERGWWDVAFDPDRYRLRGSTALVRVLGRLTPRPHLVLVLEAPAHEIRRRKRELTVVEIRQQAGRWRTALPPSVRRAYLDAGQPPERLCAAAAAELSLLAGVPRRDSGWTSLPTPRSGRWLVPRGPRRVARGALLLHQPMTPSGQVGWHLAAAAARLGLLRLLPRHPGPPPDVMHRLRSLRTRAPFVAVARVRGVDRYVALLLDPDGEPAAAVKLVGSGDVEPGLLREESALRHGHQHLRAPLCAPAVLERQAGLLVLEAVAWRARLRPWRLAPAAAGAIGAYARRASGHGDAGLAAHGDFAPWNLLRTSTGWSVIDWEDAGPRDDWYDVAHYLGQSHVLLGRPRARTIARGLRGRGWVGRVLVAYADGAGLDPAGARAAFRGYLRASLTAAEQLPEPQARWNERRRRLLAVVDVDGAPSTSARRRGLRQAALGVADQGVSSLTNLAVGLWVARELGPSGFGAFSLGFAVYLVALNLSRALATEPLTVRFSSRPRDWRRATASATGTALGIGMVLGALTAVMGAAVHSATGGVLVALGITLPFLLLQDSWRFAFFSAGRPGAALLNDVVWAVALLLALAVVTRGTTADAATYCLAWGGAAGAAALAGLAQTRVAPGLLQLPQWLRDHRDLGPRFAVEYLTESGSLQVVVYAVGGLAGLAAVGALRGGQMLLGPVVVLSTGLTMVAVPQAVKALNRSSRALRRLCQALAAGLAAASLAWGGVLLSISDELGAHLMGTTWASARDVVPPLVLAACGTGIVIGAQVGLRATAAAGRSLRARVALSAVVVAAAVSGAVTNGAVGAACGLAVAAWAGTLMWWRQLSQALGDHERRAVPA